MSQASFLIVRMPHWIKRKRGGDGEGRKWEGGLWLIFFKGVGVWSVDLASVWGGDRGCFALTGGISDVDSGRLLRSACDWRAWPLAWGGGALCPVGQSQTLPMGGGVNNVATGKINCRQAAGLRGALWWGEGSLVGKASDLSGPEEISQGRLTFPLWVLL